MSLRLPRTLVLLTLTHALVDAYAAMVQPLWPDLQRSFALDAASLQGVFILWTFATSMSQIVFGYLGDRMERGWLLWAGTAVGILGMSAVGLAGSATGLGAFLVVGGLGIAAFHPEAAAMAGATVPAERSRAMSLFSVGGYVGQAIGPIVSGVVSTRLGMRSLAWGGVVGLTLLVALGVGMSGTRAIAASPSGRVAPVSLGDLFRGRRRAVGVLLMIGVLRVLSITGIPLALAFLLKDRGLSNEEIGLAQSVFLGAVGSGSLGCAIALRGARERQALWLLPVLSIPFLLAAPRLGFVALVGCSGMSGLLIGAVMPILVGYGQRLLHEGQRLASSITMGVTWGVGGVVVAGVMVLCQRLNRPSLAFEVFAAAAAASSLLCGWLPGSAPEPVAAA